MSLTRRAIDLAAAWSGVLARRERSMRGRLTILMYHRVLPLELWAASPLPQLVMPREAFEAQVRLLRARFAVLPLGEALAALDAGDDRALVSLTFDDGYADNALHAREILDAQGVRATFFVVADLLGTTRELWFDRAARYFAGATRDQVVGSCARAGRPSSADAGVTRAGWMALLKGLHPSARDALLDDLGGVLGNPAGRGIDRLMSADQVRALSASGHEIGAHSATHPILTTLDDRELEAEVSGVRARLEAMLGRAVRGFCCPNGTYDARVLAAIGRAGYAYAPTTRFGRVERGASPLELPRIDANPSNVTNDGVPDGRAFRGELTLLHHDIRRRLGR